MTENKDISKKKSLGAGQALFCIMSAVALFLTVTHSDIAISSMLKGMELCVHTLIPSLFPFMVLSDIFVTSGAAQMLSRPVGRLFSRAFGICQEGVGALLLGVVCGFPVGTRSALSLYERGRISRGELEHLLSFCNGPSSAFLIFAVGDGLFGSRRFGILLCVAEALSALIIGIAARRYFAAKKRKCESLGWLSEEKADKKTDSGKQRGAYLIVDAVSSNALNMLTICSFVVFFSALTGFLQAFAEYWRLGGECAAFLIGFFEMTGGVSAAAEYANPVVAPLIAAALVGWSGLSVHFQFISLCKDYEFSKKPYFVAKIARSALDVAIVCVGMRWV